MRTGPLKAKVDELREIMSRLPVIGLLLRALVRGSSTNAKDMAASIAFYTFLSLFPLILGILAIASTVLHSEELQLRVLAWIEEFIPVGSDWVIKNIDSMMRMRGAAGLTSVIVLFWSARKMVAAISRGINEALELERTHAALLSPLRNYALLVAVALLMLGSAALAPLADLVAGLLTPRLPEPWSGYVTVLGGHLVGFLITASMIGITYFLVPFEKQRWSFVWPGMLVAALLIEGGKKAMVYWVENLSRLDAVYGSITSMILLMLWLYFFGRTLLYGAEVNYLYAESRAAERDRS